QTVGGNFPGASSGWLASRAHASCIRDELPRPEPNNQKILCSLERCAGRLRAWSSRNADRRTCFLLQRPGESVTDTLGCTSSERLFRDALSWLVKAALSALARKRR